MKLTQLLKPWQIEESECTIKNIKNDSRLIEPGDLFIAYPGEKTDGRLYISKAVSAGAVAVIYEPKDLPNDLELPKTVPCVAMSHVAEKLAEIAHRFYANPSQFLEVIGITGTNGKTTIAYQLAQAHDLLKQKAAYIGTIG
ncbi:MAG: Mur ligase domain-containing protein, partial [bacterium]|nr:Mur ligase domain-containing protein [bacterium]